MSVVVNATSKMAKAIEDIGMANVVANVDIGHLCILREGPNKLEKLRDRILHVHLSETEPLSIRTASLELASSISGRISTKCWNWALRGTASDLRNRVSPGWRWAPGVGRSTTQIAGCRRAWIIWIRCFQSSRGRFVHGILGPAETQHLQNGRS